MKNIFLYPVEAVNAITSNVWSIVLICAGSVLTLHAHSDIGGSLITGGFAILRGQNTDSNPKEGPSNVQPKL